MKILLVWPMPNLEVKILLDGITQADHEIVYWVGEKPVAHLTPSSAVFHDHYEAWDGKPADAYTDVVFPPVSAELIKGLYRVESLVLTMMNKRYDKAPVDERKHTYYSMLTYWNGVLDRTKPDAIIFGIVPHTVYNYILYELAALRGLPIFCFEETWVAGRLLSYRDFWKGDDKLRRAFREAKSRGVSLNDLDPELRSYYTKQKHPEESKTPWYVHDQKSIAAGVGLWTHRLRIALASPLRIVPRAYALLMRSFRSDLSTEYRRVVKDADLNRPYIYFPLNFQPERTTSPQGDIYHDQILAIETLSAALPEEWEIYVKEHPLQWWLRGKTRFSSARYPGYYDRIAKIPKTRLVPIHTDTFALLEHAKTTATITGNVGWEALLRGKKPLIFGIPWYRDCPGALKVESVESCRTALREVQEGAGLIEGDIIAFLRALEETGTRAHLGVSGSVWPVIDDSESMRVVTERVVKELKEMSR